MNKLIIISGGHYFPYFNIQRQQAFLGAYSLDARRSGSAENIYSDPDRDSRTFPQAIHTASSSFCQHNSRSHCNSILCEPHLYSWQIRRKHQWVYHGCNGLHTADPVHDDTGIAGGIPSGLHFHHAECNIYRHGDRRATSSLINKHFHFTQ